MWMWSCLSPFSPDLPCRTAAQRACARLASAVAVNPISVMKSSTTSDHFSSESVSPGGSDSTQCHTGASRITASSPRPGRSTTSTPFPRPPAAALAFIRTWVP